MESTYCAGCRQGVQVFFAIVPRSTKSSFLAVELKPWLEFSDPAASSKRSDYKYNQSPTHSGLKGAKQFSTWGEAWPRSLI